MKRILFLIMAIVMSLNGYAQDEFNSKFKPIPPMVKSPKAKKAVPPKRDLPKVIPPPVVKKPVPLLPINAPKSNFIKPEGVVYRKNQNLGSFKTKSITSKIRYRDAAYVDGDSVRVYLNDKVVDYVVVLNGEFKGLEVKLEKGINKIEFEALNEGYAPPNTAEFQVYDDKGSLISSSQWNLGVGYRATLTLIKE